MDVPVLRNNDNGLTDLIQWTGLDNIMMLEIGSFAGESAEIFALTGKVKTIWCIDPWEAWRDPGWKVDFNKAEIEFDKRAAKYPSIIHKFKGTLEMFIHEFPDITPDLVYIDALHTYEACRNDIFNSLKLKPKFISGHDYVVEWGGVKRAVDETFGKPDMTFSDTSWAVARIQDGRQF